MKQASRSQILTKRHLRHNFSLRPFLYYNYYINYKKKLHYLSFVFVQIRVFPSLGQKPSGPQYYWPKFMIANLCIKFLSYEGYDKIKLLLLVGMT